MRNVSLAIIVFMLLAAACQEEDTVGTDPKDRIKTYTIHAGAHEAAESILMAVKGERMRFRARFDSSAIYQTIDPDNQQDINKLYGMSDCGTDHQTNSARFGWRWFNERLEIWAYSYVNEERKYVFIKAVPLNSFVEYEILFTDARYVFKVNDKTVSIPRGCNRVPGGYRLYPYFGGDETAPHTISIQIEDIQ